MTSAIPALLLLLFRSVLSVSSPSPLTCSRNYTLPRLIRTFRSMPILTFTCDSPEKIAALWVDENGAKAEALIFRHASLEHMPVWGGSVSAPASVPAATPLSPSTTPLALLNPPRRLRYLDVSHNALEALVFADQPLTLRHSLEVLDASWNRLDTLVASDFAGMESLRSLIVNHNSLDLPDKPIFHGAPNLGRIDLSHNPLRVLRSAWFQGLYQLQHVVLSNTQLKEVAIESFLSNRLLSHLDLSENLLVTLHPRAFAGLESLSWLSLAGNLLEEVPTLALRGLPGLEILSLDRNHFPELAEGDFSALNLSSLSLNNQEEMTLIQAHAFNDLPRLRTLQMSWNKWLRYIHPLAFVRVPLLSALYLQSNQLQFLPQELLEGRNVNVSLSHNPFLCDCNIHWIVSHLAKLPRSRAAAVRNSPASAAEVVHDGLSTEPPSAVPPVEPVIHFLESYKYGCKMPDSTATFLLSHIPPRMLREKCPPKMFSTFKERQLVREAGTSLRLFCWGSGLPRPRITWQLPGGRRMYIVPRKRRRSGARRRKKRRRNDTVTVMAVEKGPQDVVEVLDRDIGARVTVDSGGLTLRDLRVSDSGEYRCRGRGSGNVVMLRFVVSVHDSSFRLMLLGTTHNTITVTWSGHPRRLQHLYKLGVRAYSTHKLDLLQQEVILKPRMRSHTFAHLHPAATFEVCLQPVSVHSTTKKMHCVIAETNEIPEAAEKTGIRE